MKLNLIKVILIVTFFLNKLEKDQIITILFGRERLPLNALVLSPKLARFKPKTPEV